MRKILQYSAVVMVLLLAVGCALPHPPMPSDPHNPLKRIAVLPFKNDTVDVDGPVMVRNKIIEALQNRSYIVQDQKETDQILRDRFGITLGGQVELASIQKLGEELGVEGVFTGTLMDFDELTTGVVNVRKVRGKFKLVSTQTGNTFWSRGLGVKSETRMEGGLGALGSIATRAADADKEVPWVLLESRSTHDSSVGKNLLMGVGTRLAMTALGKHLDHESTELARRLFDNLGWGPGAGGIVSAPTAPHVVAAAPPVAIPEIKPARAPQPPTFSHMEFGRKDFTALMITTMHDKSKKGVMVTEAVVAKAGEKFRTEIDLAKGNPDARQGMPPGMTRMVTISRGDKDVSWTLYPDRKRYIVNDDKGHDKERHGPKIDKTRIGGEIIDGHPTDKFKMVITDSDGKTHEGLVWLAKDLDGMAIRTETENDDFKMITEMKRVMLKRPDAALFEIPAGFVEAKGMMELMMEGRK